MSCKARSMPVIRTSLMETKPSPRRFCDLAMKGGITSGVVYPRAVTKLAEKFSFKNIGGTSAGAIAAAAAAAAELGRDSGGFARLAELPGILGQSTPDGTKSNLCGFFQPQPATRKVFEICMAALGSAQCRRLCRFMVVYRAALVRFPTEAFLGAIPSLLLFWGACVCANGGFFIICLISALILFFVGLSTGLVLAVLGSVGRGLPRNFYGLCTGMGQSDRGSKNQPDSSEGQPLTVWLADYLDTLAGRASNDRPLTFGDLWGTSGNPGERRINLEMMTTCVTHGRPYRLPFRDDDEIRENGLFYFRPDDFRRLFPERVVKWMEEKPRHPSGEKPEDGQRREQLAANGFRPLPDPRDMPVVVAVRMSLSFPILLSAIPLYAVDWSRDPSGKRPERCWFSDGGICSNFPIYFSRKGTRSRTSSYVSRKGTFR
jgi:hypothetical protein